MPGPLTCLRPLSGGLILSPVPPSSGKMGTHYLFSSRSGERESSFLGPVRDCSALQTTSLRPTSVSRGSKPCREEGREGQAGRRGSSPSPFSALPLWVPGAGKAGPPAWIVGHENHLYTISQLSLESSLLPPHSQLRHSHFLPQTELRWPGLGAHPSPWSLTSKGLEKSGSWPPSSPARVQRRMTARHSSSTATGHSAISWE